MTNLMLIPTSTSHRVADVIARLCLVHLAVLLSLASPAWGQEDYERWYEIEINNQRAGWAVQSLTTEGDTITSQERAEITLRRGKQSMVITQSKTIVETKDGKPVRIDMSSLMGGMPGNAEYVFSEEGVTLTTSGVGPQKTQELPLPSGTWLTPAAAEVFVNTRLKAGAETIEFRTLVPDQGVEPVFMKMTRDGSQMIGVLGKDIEAQVWKVTAQMKGQTITETRYTDDEGVTLRSETDMGGMMVRLTLSTEAEAKNQPEEAPELLISTFVRPDRKIDSPRTAKKASFVLTLEEDAMPELPAAGGQQIEKLDEHRARVTVRTDSTNPPAGEDADRDEYTQASANLDSDDPAIRRLAARAIKGINDDPAARAEALRKYVYKHIDAKDMSVGFASASEVAATGRGDCSEHAVLLAAMLRAEGIPSRVVSGLIYADTFSGEENIFAYHMWTQAIIESEGEGRWVDLDATLPERAFDATHIALTTSSLAEGEMVTSLMPLVSLLGRLQVEVESVK